MDLILQCLVQHFSRLKKQAEEVMKRLKEKLPTGNKLYIFLGACFLVAGMLFTLFGFTRAFVLVLLLGYVGLFSGAQDEYKKCGGGLKGAKGALDFLGRNLGTHIKKLTGKDLNPKLVLALVCLVLALFLYTGTTGSRAPPPVSRTSYARSQRSKASRSTSLEEAYKAGWDDRDQDKDFMFSFESLSLNDEEDDDNLLDDDDEDDYIPPPTSSRGSSGFGLSNLIMLGFFGKNIYELGGSPWNLQRFIANFKALPPWRMVLFGFLILRIVGLSPI